MEEYLKSLELQQKLLLANNEPFWADWIQKDMNAWDRDKTTQHHLDAFGGAGSYNDVNLNYGENLGYWKNALLSNLATVSYCLAKGEKFVMPNNGGTSLECVKCQKCDRVETNENNISRFVAGRFIPFFMNELFLTNAYANLLDLEKLAADARVGIFTDKLKEELLEMKIEIKTDNNAWNLQCISCLSSEKIYSEFSPKTSF